MADIKSMAARLMDDQRNGTTPHKPVTAIKPKTKTAAAPPAAPAKAVKKSKAA